MKEFLFKIVTKVKDEIKNPVGEVVEDIVKRLEISKEIKVNTGKYFEIKLKAKDMESIQGLVDKIASEILSNPLVENYEILEVYEIN